ncbi:GID complex subunit containing RING finger motif [Ciborinia camelliae]|nr:GID complex subunit containing RING finger motif [Ciborinia camelliae]
MPKPKMAPAPLFIEASDTMLMKKADIVDRLVEAKIKFEGSSVKPILQATYALYQIGYLKPETNPPQTLIDTIAEWWSMTAAALKKDVKEKKLDGSGSLLTKNQCLNLLLRDTISNWQEDPEKQEDVGNDESIPNEALENLSLQQSRRASSLSGIPEYILKLSAAIELNPQVINLILSSAFIMVCLLRVGTMFPESSISISYQDFEDGHFPNFEMMILKGEMEKSLQNMKIECRNLISHITKEYSHILSPAKSDLWIPGFPASVSQFVVIRTPKHISDKVQEFKGKKTDRMVLFHGTGLSFLPIILLEGLKATCQDLGKGDGRTLWMAEEPATSFLYGRKDVNQGFYSTWKHNLYPHCGVLLGCERLSRRKCDVDYEEDSDGDIEIGRPQPVHIFRPDDTTSIVVRYVFILPRDVLNRHDLAPRSSDLRPLMLKAFKSKIFQNI